MPATHTHTHTCSRPCGRSQVASVYAKQSVTAGVASSPSSPSSLVLPVTFSAKSQIQSNNNTHAHIARSEAHRARAAINVLSRTRSLSISHGAYLALQKT